jgi:arabinofuranosyltransferase
MRRILLTLAGVIFASLVLMTVFAGNRIRLAQDVELAGATITREVTPGGKLGITLRFAAKHPLDADDWVFVHVESESGDSHCRLTNDQLPNPPPTAWHEQEIVHSIEIPVSASCAPGSFVVYAGLYNRVTGERLKAIEPAIADNRIPVGTTAIVTSDPSDGAAEFTPRAIRRGLAWVVFAPLLPWAVAVAVASALASWAYVRRRPEDDEEDETSMARPHDRETRWVTFFAPAIPFLFGILVVLEFIKDDAYISFRYAHNLVTGHGLVFNTGERLEGFTNFLWVFILAPFEALGWDLFQVCEVLGSALGIGCLVVTGLMTGWVNGERKSFAHLWGAFWLATSSSFVLWAKSGLEQPLASLLPIAGAYVLWRARDGLAHDPDPARAKILRRRYLYAGLIMGAACMTRPELHLLAILVALPSLADVVKRRGMTTPEWLYLAGVLAFTIPCHAFRYLYYGTLVPNTFYVKTGTSALVWHEGIKTLRDMFGFNAIGALVLLAPFAFANRRRLVEKVTMTVIAVAFMVYYVKVGVDEMQWHRLYLPALPFLCVLAALGASNLIGAIVRAIRGRGPAAGDDSRARLIGDCIGWAAFLVAGGMSFKFTYDEVGGFNGHGDLAGTYHPDLGKFLVRHERPGALVAFQDMGSTPYHAPDINFLDFFGLVDRTVAHARHDFGLHTFVGGDADNVKPKFDAAMRDYFFERNPEWAILTIYAPKDDRKKVSREFDEDPTGGRFGDAYNDNEFQFDIWRDPRFQERYVPVRTWPRSVSYYLALWRRRDLWNEVPREVVLDAPPPNMGGVQGTFEGGLELLGSQITEKTLERHEAFVTTWWRLPGPMGHDLYFFLHFAKEGFQAPADHVPGDWMYPADRWKAGEILEDRTLFQLPPFTMSPGTYKVYLGVYRRGAGERLKVTSAAGDGQNRVLLGTLVVKERYPLIEQLIPPTHVDVMRAHPERIVDSKRPQGT